MALSESEIAHRITQGELFCQRFSQNDRQASAKFRDPSNSFPYISDEDAVADPDGGDVPVDVPVGEPNLVATNIIVKGASIAINYPDFVVKSKTDNMAFSELVRKFMKDSFRLKGWTRRSQEALQKTDVAGLGCLAYRWDKERHSTFETVYTWQLSIDPNTVDWENVEWAARKIRLSLRKAIARFGHPKDEEGNPYFPEVGEGDGRLDSERLDFWLYYDRESEIVQYDGRTIKESENQYHAVPFLFLLAHPDPGPSIWPISNNVLAAGLQAGLTQVNDIITNSAINGRPILYGDAGRLSSESKEALENLQQQGFVPVDDMVTPPFGRLPGEELSPSLLERQTKYEQSIDAVMGVTEYMRGVITSDPKFATQVGAASQSSGAMGNKSRIEFERFLVRMAEVVVFMEIEFGGPEYDTEGNIKVPDEVMALWQAMQDVSEINVLECSTTYKDPTFELQQAMQRLNVIAQLMPIFFQMGGMIPNLQELVNDVYRYSNIHDTSRYWVQAPMPMMGAMGPQATGSGMQPPQVPS